ncbi:TPA: hypothetical protein ACGIK9_003384 [Acinetobacter baumannii]|uniref:hypothetical protein n=1 Tax=Acinetobacter baumannii TaxID=470 RepID=UPI00338F5BC7
MGNNTKVKVGSTVIVRGDDADVYTEYTVQSIEGLNAKLEGEEGNFLLTRLVVVD